MKTTIDIPDPLFRRAKLKAAERGQTLKEFVGEALQEKLAAKASKVQLADQLPYFDVLTLQTKPLSPTPLFG
jgi:hypothetical protein